MHFIKNISFFIINLVVVSDLFMSGKGLSALAPSSTVSQRIEKDTDNLDLSEGPPTQNDLNPSEQIGINKSSQSNGMLLSEALNNSFTWISLVLLLLSALFFLLFYVAGLHYYGIIFPGIVLGVIAIMCFIRAIVITKRNYDGTTPPPPNPAATMRAEGGTPSIRTTFLKGVQAQLNGLFYALNVHLNQYSNLLTTPITDNDVAKSLMFLTFDPAFRDLVSSLNTKFPKINMADMNDKYKTQLNNIKNILDAIKIYKDMPEEDKKQHTDFKSFYESFDIDLDEKETSSDLMTIHIKQQEALKKISLSYENHRLFEKNA